MLYNLPETETLTETFRKQLVQRLSRSFLDILILRLIQTEPMWGYKIIKKSKKLFGIQLGHGKLYPLLNSLNNEGFLASKKTIKGGRTLKVYKITPKGKQFVETYIALIDEQLQSLDLKEA